MAERPLLMFLLVALTFNVALTTYAQTDTIVLELCGNSCQPYFDSNKISIHYSYSISNQTHDYSNNWDFDGDEKKDSLYFIGTGGAHLYFYLRIVLSSDQKIRDFPFLQLDMPCYGNIKQLKNFRVYPPPFPQFVVDDFITDSITDNANDKIYLHLDGNTFAEIRQKQKRQGITSSYLLLKYEKGEIVIKNFMK
jgi:hypothetical protein